MKLLAHGSVLYADRDRIWGALDKVHARTKVTMLLTTDARGACYEALEWAKSNGVTPYMFIPDFQKYGHSAIQKLNKRIIAEGAPEGMVAFPGNKHTAELVEMAKAIPIPVWQPYGR